MLTDLYQKAAPPLMQCDAASLQNLYTKCADTTEGYLQNLYQVVDCTATAKQGACIPHVPANHTCNEPYLLEMYTKCESATTEPYLQNLYQEVDCAKTAQQVACEPVKATKTMACDADSLTELYTKCADTTEGYLQDLYQVVDCHKAAKTTACTPVVPETHTCDEPQLMEMYQKCDEGLLGNGEPYLLEMYQKDCVKTALTVACVPKKTAETITCPAAELQELYAKCADTTEGYLQNLYQVVDCQKAAKTKVCSPVVPVNHTCEEPYLMEMYQKCDDALLENESSALAELYQKDCTATAQQAACTPIVTPIVTPVVPVNHTCNEPYLMELYTKCADTTMGYLQNLYQVVDCHNAAQQAACTPFENPIGPGEYTPYGPGEYTPYGPGETTPYGPGETTPYGPGETTPYGPGETTPYGPGETTPYGPGETTPYGPGETTPYGPGYTGGPIATPTMPEGFGGFGSGGLPLIIM